MILAVTLNPCLDKTLTVPPWSPGDNVRGTAVREVVGGKGNNVARALKRLGRPVRPVTFLGGPAGARCEAMLREVDGLDPIAIPTAAPTRVILTVRTEGSDEQSAFFDPDPAITAVEAKDLYHRVEGTIRAAEPPVTLLTLSGSSPSEETHQLYSDLIALARAHKIPVLLDTYGPALESIWGFWPDALQMNRREAAGFLKQSADTIQDEEILAALEEWGRHGVKVGIVTDGPNGVLAAIEGRFFRAYPPEIQAVNPIGSGDSFLAGLADAHLAGLGPEATLRRAIACAVSNALTWDAGSIDPDQVREQEAEVAIETLARASQAAPPTGILSRSNLGMRGKKR